jgi:energy-coupling factor transporter ATP-binding protein EcfA2
VLAVEQADLGYGRSVVLREVSVQIHQGEFWCLLGPNGEGKSTFIKALLGAIRPLRGKIFLRPDFANRTRLGFVPQECELNPALLAVGCSVGAALFINHRRDRGGEALLFLAFGGVLAGLILAHGYNFPPGQVIVFVLTLLALGVGGIRQVRQRLLTP